MLRVPEGDSVTATGSSKKIAKNIAAKLMLDKLENMKIEEDQVSSEHFINFLILILPFQV